MRALPVYIGSPHAAGEDVPGACLAGYGVLLALLADRHTSKGLRFCVARFAAGVGLLWGSFEVTHFSCL